MVGCELLSSHMLTLGLMVAYYTTLTCCVRESSDCATVSAKYQHCRTDPDGVHDLDCFAKEISKTKCVWKPGKHASHRNYTLIIRQRQHCVPMSNITKESVGIKIYAGRNMTAEVFETSRSSSCTKAVFHGAANSWARCGPPHSVSFWRRHGKLNVNITWPQEDTNFISDSFVKYKTVDSQSWNKTLVRCHRGQTCTVQHLDSSLGYAVQTQCATNAKCSQCPWSQTYTVPPELTTPPHLDLVQDRDIAEGEGRRLLVLTWTSSAEEPFDGYNVTVAKASGEASGDWIVTTEPKVRLVLSYSAFHVSIRVFNNVSSSPAANRTIPQRPGLSSARDARLNVTVHGTNSFTVRWKQHPTYVCYCVEWSKKGHKAFYKSFFEDEKNSRTITISPDQQHLEPYERYTITLLTRPNKDTCNLKHVNGSERTYGSTQFYFMQGTPVSAPANFSSYNVTVNSAPLQWSPIPEDDTRGFLLGYTVHYVEYGHSGTERNVTVDPEVNHYNLDNLKSGTTYEAQISGFTQAGGGVRSASHLFKTNPQGYFDLNLGRIITILAVVLIVLLFGPTIMKRTKVVVWPSIPNPGNSNAMKQIEGTCEMEMLESVNMLKVEEWETDSLQIVEKETLTPADSLPHLQDSEDEGLASDWFQKDTEAAPGGILAEAADVPHPTHGCHSSHFTYTSEYTTMEMFSQMMPPWVQAHTDATEAEKSESGDADLTVVKSEVEYIRQFSSSPTTDSELTTFL